MNENNNLQESQVTQETNRTTERSFDYINQKPQHSRKALIALGSVVVALIVCLITGVCYVRSHAEALITSPFGWIVAGLAPDLLPDDEESIRTDEGEAINEILGFMTDNNPTIGNGPAESNDPGENSASEDVLPEFTEKKIVIALYQTTLDDDTVMTTSADEGHAGYYALQPGTVYTIKWDASPLYRNEDGEVDAKITVKSDFLIGGGIDGEGIITVNIRDYHRHIDYTGELHIAAESGNLGIEFCADKCHIRSYGFCPEIEDGEFYVSFYTSGKYVDEIADGRYGVDGHYSFTYGTDGDEALNGVVTQPDSIPEPNPVLEPKLELPTLNEPTPTSEPVPKKKPAAKDPTWPNSKAE